VFFTASAAFWVRPAPFSKVAHLEALEALRGQFLELLDAVVAAVEENTTLLDQVVRNGGIGECNYHGAGLAWVRRVSGPPKPSQFEDFFHQEMIFQRQGDLIGGAINIKIPGDAMC
jgi:hypothetical protein